MLPGTIVMLVLVIVVIYGGSVFLIKKTLDGEGKNTPEEEIMDTLLDE